MMSSSAEAVNLVDHVSILPSVPLGQHLTVPSPTFEIWHVSLGPSRPAHSPLNSTKGLQSIPCGMEGLPS
jgi:hypothetical protein